MINTKLYAKQRWITKSDLTSNADKRIQFTSYDAPSVKEFLLVLLAIAVLIALCWFGYHKLGWFH